MRPSYLFNGNPYTDETTFFYWDAPWAPSQYLERRLSVRSRKVSKPRNLYLELSDRSEIWQCCRCACQISKRYDNLKYQSRGFETLRDLTKRRLFGYWDGALVSMSLSMTLWLFGSPNRCTLLWRHNERDSVSNHQRLYCSLKRLFRRRSKVTSKLRVTGLCAWNSPGTGEFPAKKASNAENVSIWWRHHDIYLTSHQVIKYFSSNVKSYKCRSALHYKIWLSIYEEH